MNPQTDKRRDAETQRWRTAAVSAAADGFARTSPDFDSAGRWMSWLLRLGQPRSIFVAASLLLFAVVPHAFAQSADDFFHNGAQQYITNNVQGALLTVTNGLQQFPDDEKLKKLWELLNQQQQQQQQDQKDQEQQKQDQPQQDQQKDQKDQSQQFKDEQQKQEDEQKDQQAKNSQDQQKQDQKNQSGKPEKSDEQKQAEQAMQAHAMTAQEAKQLLDAQKDKEQVLIFKPQGEPKKAQQKPVKDW